MHRKSTFGTRTSVIGNSGNKQGVEAWVVAALEHVLYERRRVLQQPPPKHRISPRDGGEPMLTPIHKRPLILATCRLPDGLPAIDDKPTAAATTGS